MHLKHFTRALYVRIRKSANSPGPMSRENLASSKIHLPVGLNLSSRTGDPKKLEKEEQLQPYCRNECQQFKTLPTSKVCTWNKETFSCCQLWSYFRNKRHARNPDMLEMVTWQGHGTGNKTWTRPSAVKINRGICGLRLVASSTSAINQSVDSRRVERG